MWKKRLNSPLLLALAALLTALEASPAAAQQAPAVEEAKRRELEALREKITQSSRRKAALEEERAALAREAEAISARLVELAARMQAAESILAENEKRISELEGEEAALKARFAMSRASIAELLAGLQKLRRDPPPPFVTRPREVLSAVRGAILLSAAVPEADRRAKGLLRDIRRLKQVRAGLKGSLEEKRRTLARLARTREQIGGLLARKRKLMQAAGHRLREENRRLAQLAEKARTLSELIAALRREEERRRKAEEARREEEKRRQAEAGKGAAKETPPEAKKPAPPPLRRPRVAFARMKGRLPWPVQGRLLHGFNEKTPLGARSQGMYVLTRPGASVIAPADAQVKISAPFRSYGHLLILDGGGGYHILLAGLKKASVGAGQFVRAGEPLGTMGAKPAPATVTGSRVENTSPILYMELRKNGRPVDAAPWWPRTRKEARK